MIAELGNAVSAGFNWWAGELVDSLPVRVRNSISFGNCRLLACFDSAGIVITYSGATENQLNISYAEYPDTQDTGQRIAKWLRRNRLKANGITFLLPAELVLNPTFEIPAEAARSLPEISIAEIEKQTPFTEAQVYHRLEVTGTNTDLDTIGVRMTVARIEDVNRAVAVANAAGISDVVVSVGNETDADNIDLVPKSSKNTGLDASRWTVAALLLTIFMLLAAAIYLPIERMQKVNSLADAEIAELKVRNDTIQQSGKQNLLLKHAYQELADRKSRSPSQLKLLNEVTRYTPDHSWLLQIQLDKTKVVMSGFSTDANDLVRSLEKSELLQNVTFSAPVTTDNRLGIDRVYIKAELSDQESS